MAIDNKFIDKKLHDINREAAKIPALSTERIDQFEYLTSEEILPPAQSRMIEQANFTYSPLGKTFEKQIKANENKEENQTKTIESELKLLNCS